jgi:uncharacterized protein YdcH (DUF465 family)
VTTARTNATIHSPTHRANQSYTLGVATSQGDRSLMENTQEELKTHLMQSDDEFRQLAEQHARYHGQLEALEAKSHLTPQEEVEEHRLKKVKLQLKDQMNEILSRYRTQHV